MDFGEIADLTSTELKSEYDYSVEKRDIVNSFNTTNTTWSTYNNSNPIFDFVLNAGNFVDLSSPLSGIVCRFAMRGDNIKADLSMNGTMSNNWFNYYYSGARLSIAGVEIESVGSLGIFTDIEYHMMSGYNKEEMESAGFIKDGHHSGKPIDFFTSAQAIIPGNTPANIFDYVKILQPNADFNRGYYKRLQTYGKITAANQTIYAYVPLKHIFKFCQRATNLLAYVNIKIELFPVPEGDRNQSFLSRYDAAQEVLNISQANNTGVIDLKLNLLGMSLKPSLSLEYEKRISGDTYIDFDARIFQTIDSFGDRSVSRTITSQSRPRYIFVISKRYLNDSHGANNRQTCPNCDIESIQIDFGINGNIPKYSQLGDFTNNKFLDFYTSFADITRSLTGLPLKMSIKDFKELYTIFAFDVRSQPPLSLPTWSFNVNITRKAIPAETVIADHPCPSNPKDVRYFIICYLERRCVINQKLNRVSMINPGV